jgi:glycosyltransferase involved in cell wall biosynthesis
MVPGAFTPLPAPTPSILHRFTTAARQGPSLLGAAFARSAFWTSPVVHHAMAAASEFKPDLVHANDWSTLPVAVRLGVPFVYDSHEFATGEQDERLLWRLLFKPYISAMEGAFIRKAGDVVTVSEGIAERLEGLYGLPKRPTVIRNMPLYEESAFRRTGESIEVLYHGAYHPNRGLECVIDSVALWPPNFRLKLRGIGAPHYIDALRKRALGSTAHDRIIFADPVRMDDLVQAAATSDVGIFTIPPYTVQADYVLPNKFFEYTMAGLCLVVSRAKEMSKEVERRGLGVVANGTSPRDIAAAISTLTRDRIDAAKQASLAAARELNWDREKSRLSDLWRIIA